MSLKAIDPVCGMEISMEAAFVSVKVGDEHVYFCAPSCLKAFQENPSKYMALRQRNSETKDP